VEQEVNVKPEKKQKSEKEIMQENFKNINRRKGGIKEKKKEE
jgi:hypothetical protein